MTKPSVPLTALSEAQRTQALERFAIICPALEAGVTRAKVARTQQLPPSTVQRWIAQYHAQELVGLAPATRSDKGKARKLPLEAIRLVEGLALQTPPRSTAAIHHQLRSARFSVGRKICVSLRGFFRFPRSYGG